MHIHVCSLSKTAVVIQPNEMCLDIHSWMNIVAWFVASMRFEISGWYLTDINLSYLLKFASNCTTPDVNTIYAGLEKISNYDLITWSTRVFMLWKSLSSCKDVVNYLANCTYRSIRISNKSELCQPNTKQIL